MSVRNRKREGCEEVKGVGQNEKAWFLKKEKGAEPSASSSPNRIEEGVDRPREFVNN